MAKKQKAGKSTIEYGLPMPPELYWKTEKARRVSLGRDKDGFFVYTHRVRSKSYRTARGIPKKQIESIESTG